MATTIKLLAVMGLLLIVWIAGTYYVMGIRKRREAEKKICFRCML